MKTKTIKLRKGLSALLSLCMVLAMFPMSALAADEGTEGPMPKPDGGVITLTEDITLAAVYTVSKSETLTIDLDGYKITNATGQHTIVNNGTLTIKNSSVDKTGVVDNVSHGKGALVNNGTATLESGKLTRSAEAGTSAGANGNSWYVVDNHGTLNVTGGTIINTSGYSSLIRNLGTMKVSGGEMKNAFIAIKNDEAGKDKLGVLNVTGGTITSQNQAIQNWSTATISGATITGDIGTWAYKYGDDIFAGQTTVSGGSIGGNIVVSIYNVLGENPSSVPSVTISSGIVKGEVTATTPGTIEITGGTYTVNPSAYVADGYIATKENNTFVVKKTPVEPETITVTFDLNYEDAVGAPDAATAGEEGKITLPEDPTREGFTFGGWFTSEDEGETLAEDAITEETVFTEDTTVYAKWTADIADLAITVDSEGTITGDEATAEGTLSYYLVDADKQSVIDGWNVETAADDVATALGVAAEAEKPTLAFANNGKFLVVVKTKDDNVVAAGQSNVIAIDSPYTIASISGEVEGGAGLTRTITTTGTDGGQYLVVQITEGTGAAAKVSVVMVKAENTVTISYKTTASVQAWITDRMPSLSGSGATNAIIYDTATSTD